MSQPAKLFIKASIHSPVHKFELIQYMVAEVPCASVGPGSSWKRASVFAKKLADIRIYHMKIVAGNLNAHREKKYEIFKIRETVPVNAAGRGAAVAYCLCKSLEIWFKKGI